MIFSKKLSICSEFQLTILVFFNCLTWVETKDWLSILPLYKEKLVLTLSNSILIYNDAFVLSVSCIYFYALGCVHLESENLAFLYLKNALATFV